MRCIQTPERKTKKRAKKKYQPTAQTLSISNC